MAGSGTPGLDTHSCPIRFLYQTRLCGAVKVGFSIVRIDAQAAFKSMLFFPYQVVYTKREVYNAGSDWPGISIGRAGVSPAKAKAKAQAILPAFYYAHIVIQGSLYTQTKRFYKNSFIKARGSLALCAQWVKSGKAK